MNAKAIISAVLCSIAGTVFLGCAVPATSNTKKNREDLARVEERAKRFEKKDGSLSGDYIADVLLNGSGKKSNKPVFDQPRGDENARD